MGLKVTLTLQMQAPHSDFWCLLAAPAAILCENHNSVFLFLLGTHCYLWASSVELLQTLMVLGTGLGTGLSAESL